MEEQRLQNGDFVKHFKFDLYNKVYYKTGLYSIITTGVIHSETKERMVLYQNIFSGLFYVRPYDMFMSEVDKEKYPEAKQKYRFEKISVEQMKNLLDNEIDKILDRIKGGK